MRRTSLKPQQKPIHSPALDLSFLLVSQWPLALNRDELGIRIEALVVWNSLEVPLVAFLTAVVALIREERPTWGSSNDDS